MCPFIHCGQKVLHFVMHNSSHVKESPNALRESRGMLRLWRYVSTSYPLSFSFSFLYRLFAKYSVETVHCSNNGEGRGPMKWIHLPVCKT